MCESSDIFKEEHQIKNNLYLKKKKQGEETDVGKGGLWFSSAVSF